MNLYLHYNSIIRNILVYSLWLYTNTYALIFFNKLQLNFNLRKVTVLDDSSIYNYFYLIRFFFSNKAYISNYKHYYSLRVTYYSFRISCFFTRIRAYLNLGFLLNDIIPYVNTRNIRSYFYNYKMYRVILNDVSLFSEKKTNMGLYNLNERFNYEITLANTNYESTYFFLTALKVIS